METEKTNEEKIVIDQVLVSLGRLQLGPDDVLVLMCEKAISMQTAEYLKSICELAIPGRKVLVLQDGLKVGVISKTTNEPVRELETDAGTDR